VKLWVLSQPGIKEGQQGKIHCRVPHPLERRLMLKGLALILYAHERLQLGQRAEALFASLFAKQ